MLPEGCGEKVWLFGRRFVSLSHVLLKAHSDPCVTLTIASFQVGEGP